jgi:hypothetical protein
VATSGVVCGGLLLAAGPRYVLARASDGAAVGPALRIWPLLTVLAAVPPVIAVLLLCAVRSRRPAFALILSLGAAACGRLLLDLQLVLDPARAARAELVAPEGMGALSPGPGAWLQVAGQLATVVGGLAAATEFSPLGPPRRRPGAPPPWTTPARTPLVVALVGLGCAVVAGYGMLTAPFASNDPYLVPRATLDAPGWVAIGQFLLAAAVLLAVLLAGSAPEPRVAAAGMLGAALAVLGVALPRVVVAAAVESLRVTAGPVLAVLAAFGLVVLSIWVAARAGPRRSVEPRSAAIRPVVPREVLAQRWRLAGGGFAVSAGGCVVAGGMASPLLLDSDLPNPVLTQIPLLVLTGLAAAGLGLATMLVPQVRAVLGVALVAVPMVVAEPVSELVAALGLDGVHPGAGFWLLVGAACLALASVAAVLVAGGFERFGADLTRTRFEGPAAPVAAAAAVLTLPAFLLPLSDSAGWAGTGTLQPTFGLSAFRLLAAFGVCLGALLLAPRCRSGQAAGLYAGVAVVLVLRLLRAVPGIGQLGAGALGTGGLGEGAWASGLCLALVLVALAVTMHTSTDHALSSEDIDRDAGR